VQFALLIDLHALDAVDVACELGQQVGEALLASFEVLGRRAPKSQTRLTRFLEASPMFFREQIALERLIASAAE
jgi:hypothetical protein